jgi:hypothetical protein
MFASCYQAMEKPRPFEGARNAALASGGAVPRRLRVGAGIALANVLALGFFAVLSLVLELPSISLIGLALFALAWNEWRGRKLLLAADPRAPRALAQSQLLQCLVFIVYCAHGAYVAWTGPSPLDAVLGARAELAQTLAEGDLAGLDELTEWARRTALVVYGAVAVGSVVVQGLTARFYLSLRSALAALAATSPPAPNPPAA